LSANTAFGELLKLPLLFQHYLEHTHEDNSVNFFKFLEQHYSEKYTHDHQQNDQHEKLPFKTADGQFSSAISLTSPPFMAISAAALPSAHLHLPPFCQPHYSNAYLNSIWQPPRFS